MTDGSSAAPATPSLSTRLLLIVLGFCFAAMLGVSLIQRFANPQLVIPAPSSGEETAQAGNAMDGQIGALMQKVSENPNDVDMPHEVAVREQCGASVLILPLRKEPEYKATVPGKLLEYLASRRPVLGIGQTDGAMAAILSDAEAGKTFDWEDSEGIEAEIRRMWDLFCKGELNDVEGDIDKYSRRRLCKQMADLFDSLCN